MGELYENHRQLGQMYLVQRELRERFYTEEREVARQRLAEEERQQTSALNRPRAGGGVDRRGQR